MRQKLVPPPSGWLGQEKGCPVQGWTERGFCTFQALGCPERRDPEGGQAEQRQRRGQGSGIPGAVRALDGGEGRSLRGPGVEGQGGGGK